MAPYFYDPNLDDEEKQKQQELSISGAPAIASSGGQATSGSSQTKPLVTGSGFQNLDKYLSANVQSGKQLSDQFYGNVGRDIESAGKNIANASNQFKDQVNTLNPVTPQQQITESIAHPEQANKKDFQNVLKQEYKGPRSLVENPSQYQNYYSGINKANDEAKALKSSGGRFTLLDQYFGRPSYNQGQKAYDDLLLQRSGSGGQARDLQNQALALKGQAQKGANELQNYASTKAGEVEQSRNDARNAIGIDEKNQVISGQGALGKSYQDIDQQVAAKNKARKDHEERLKTELQSGFVNDKDLKYLGLSPDTPLYDLHPENYLDPATQLNRDQIMTPEQRAYIKALSNLAGIPDTYAQGQAQPETPDSTFRGQTFANDVAARKQAYENAKKSITQAINWNQVSAGNLDSYNQAQQKINDLDQQFGVNRKLSTIP